MTSLKDVTILQPLGKGSYGAVHLAVRKTDDNRCARYCARTAERGVERTCACAIATAQRATVLLDSCMPVARRR